MTYGTIVEGKFLARPNRFIAHVETPGGVQVCHVKNTGRCRELLVTGATVYLEESPNPNRKTKYDLIAVEKGDLLINMDSQAPNRVVEEALRDGCAEAAHSSGHRRPERGRNVPGATLPSENGRRLHRLFALRP